jgi:hypothetical protein
MEPAARSARSGSDSETLAALRTTTCEDLTTGSRGHAGAKAVGALTMQVAGLVGTLHRALVRANATCESCAKTSTCRGGKKGGKGTQRLPQCQAQRSLCASFGRQKDRSLILWITLGATV